MLKVNNKQTISKLASSSFKANKLRNIFAVVAIILTTVLFTGLFTVVNSLMASMEESTMRQVGGNSHGTFKYLSPDQYDRIKTHKSIVDISYSAVLGIAENEELARRPSEIRYSSGELNANGMFSLPTVGNLPQADDEIATDTLVLDRLGIPAELGQQVTLKYSVSGEQRSDTFTLVGFWEGDKLMGSSQIWLNRGYVEKQLENYVPISKSDFVGRLNADVNFSSSVNIEDKMKKVLSDSGFAPDEIDIGVNWAYMGNSDSMNIDTLLGGTAVVLMIVFCGYLIISNVFYISVAKDTRYYGLLKTIGTSGKQIRVLIRRQALLLCAIGVPLGLIAGYFVGAMLTPTVLSIINTNVIKIEISPVAFIASALFAIFTVFVSVRKPAKLASGVSPIEALRSTDGGQKSRKTTKKSGGVSLLRMALSNVSRNKKKAVMVTVSLSLSLIILNSAYSMANSFDMDKYLSAMIGSDFAIGDASHFNVHLQYADQGTLSAEFLSDLAAMDGIEQLGNIYFAEPLTDADPRLASLPARVERELELTGKFMEYMTQAHSQPQYTQHIFGYDDSVFERLNVFEGTVDMEKLKTGDYIIALPYDTEGIVKYYELGDVVSVTNAAGESKEYEVLAIANAPYNIGVQHSHSVEPGYILPSEVFLRDIADKAPMLTTLNVSDDAQAGIEAFLAHYCENVDQSMQYQSKASFAAEYANTQSTYKSIGIALSLIVAFIGIMNFINTIVTSIMARRRELAMLQSIGMTSGQSQAMLIFEGLIYTALTAIFALTIGSALGYLGINAITGGGDGYFTTNFTILPSLLCLPVLAVISAAVPVISKRAMNKDSIVERLRAVE